jgi:hypothetical protein
MLKKEKQEFRKLLSTPKKKKAKKVYSIKFN